jgi:hypothetical protein
MEASVYTGSTLTGLIYFVLAVRLLRLGFRTRSAPEHLLGLSFLLWSLYYVLRIVSIASFDRPELEAQLAIVGRVADNLANVVFVFFPLSVFRRGSTWARWLAAGMATCLIAGLAGSFWVGDLEATEPLTNLWWWPEWLGEIATAIWIGAEGFQQYGITRLRVRLGLCERIVGHRSLLWGLAGAFWTLLDFVVVGQYVDFWANQRWSVALDNLVGGLEIAALAMVWLVYFAPDTYVRRINAATDPA